MHPLLPDDFDLRTAADDAPLAQLGFRGARRARTRRRSSTQYALGDLFYSFGTTHPGAIVLRNYPKFLQEYERPDGKMIDLAVDRPRAHPRARRAPLQRVPPAAAPERAGDASPT